MSDFLQEPNFDKFGQWHPQIRRLIPGILSDLQKGMQLRLYKNVGTTLDRHLFLPDDVQHLMLKCDLYPFQSNV